MKFKVDCNYLIKTEYNIDVDPKKFLHCANIEELEEEVHQFIYSNLSLDFKNEGQEIYSIELLGLRYYDRWFETDDGQSFYVEWQKLKGLPQEL